MKITKLSINNFRCFENRVFSFDRKLTILIARNGVGKSTLLDAIALGLGSFLTRLPGVSGPRFKSTDFHLKPDGRKPAYMRIRCESECGIIWDRTERRDLAKKTLRQTPVGAGLRSLNDYVDSLINAHHRGENVTLPVFIYYGSGRGSVDAGPMRKPDYKTRFEVLDGSLESKTNFRRFLHYFSALEKKERRIHKETQNIDSELPELKAIRRAVKRLMPECSNIRSIRPEGIVVDWEKHAALPPDINNLPGDRGGDTIYPRPEQGKEKETLQLEIEQLSNGKKITLIMVMDIAARLAAANPQADNPLESTGIILIDEVDLHLHPEWQRDFLPRLLELFPNIQYIVSTHSPFILQSVKQGELIDLDTSSLDEKHELSKERSIEDIASKLMGMHDVQRSALFKKQLEVSDRYYRLLNSGKSENDAEVADLSLQLDELEAHFGDNPVYVSLLRAERRRKAREAK